jgi:hypothetical protein
MTLWESQVATGAAPGLLEESEMVLGKTHKLIPSLDSINANTLFTSSVDNGAGPGNQVTHPLIAVQESTGGVLNVAALVGIDRDRVALAEVPEACLRFLFESNGGDKINRASMVTGIFVQSRVEIGSPSAVGMKHKAESFGPVLPDALEEFLMTNSIHTSWRNL